VFDASSARMAISASADSEIPRRATNSAKRRFPWRREGAGGVGASLLTI
jgi:hypothetical protein